MNKQEKNEYSVAQSYLCWLMIPLVSTDAEIEHQVYKDNSHLDNKTIKRGIILGKKLHKEQNHE